MIYLQRTYRNAYGKKEREEANGQSVGYPSFPSNGLLRTKDGQSEDFRNLRQHCERFRPALSGVIRRNGRGRYGNEPMTVNGKQPEQHPFSRGDASLVPVQKTALPVRHVHSKTNEESLYLQKAHQS
jgi:hypothetical protein